MDRAKPNRPRELRLLKGALLAACIVRLWITPLPSSFWVDETGTQFVVQHGANHPSFAVAPQVPQSIYYWLPRVSELLANILPQAQGVRETLYRLPSLLALGLAVFIIARIAAHVIHPEAAWFAAFSCFALRGVDYEAANARPYALGILVVSAAALFLIRWLDRNRTLDAFLFIVSAACIWRVHLLFWPFYLVLICYAVSRLAASKSSVGWWRAALVFGAVGLTLIPVLFEALALSRSAADHVMASVPPIKELLRELKFGMLVTCAALGLVLRIGRATPTIARVKLAPLLLIAAWWLIPPCALYGFSVVTGNSVFVHRYLTIALPGVVLAATLTIAMLLPENRWNLAALMMGIGSLVFLGDWRQPWPAHHNSNWRAAAAAINALPNSPPVICPSPFVEAKSPAWNPDYPLPGFLYAHLAAYPIREPLLLFPFDKSPEIESWASDLKLGSKFVIYGPAPIVEFWRNWYLRQPQFSGWTSERIGSFGDVSAVVVSNRLPRSRKP